MWDPSFMLKSYGWGGWVGGWVVAHKILVSAPVPLEWILTGFDWVGLGLGGLGFGMGLDNFSQMFARGDPLSQPSFSSKVYKRCQLGLWILTWTQYTQMIQSNLEIRVDSRVATVTVTNRSLKHPHSRLLLDVLNSVPQLLVVLVELIWPLFNLVKIPNDTSFTIFTLILQ